MMYYGLFGGWATPHGRGAAAIMVDWTGGKSDRDLVSEVLPDRVDYLISEGEYSYAHSVSRAEFLDAVDIDELYIHIARFLIRAISNITALGSGVSRSEHEPHHIQEWSPMPIQGLNLGTVMESGKIAVKPVGIVTL